MSAFSRARQTAQPALEPWCRVGSSHRPREESEGWAAQGTTSVLPAGDRHGQPCRRRDHRARDRPPRSHRGAGANRAGRKARRSDADASLRAHCGSTSARAKPRSRTSRSGRSTSARRSRESATASRDAFCANALAMIRAQDRPPDASGVLTAQGGRQKYVATVRHVLPQTTLAAPARAIMT